MKTIEFLYYIKLHGYNQAIYFDTFPVIEDPIAECERNINMIKKLDQLIDKVGMSHIQSVIDKK